MREISIEEFMDNIDPYFLNVWISNMVSINYDFEKKMQEFCHYVSCNGRSKFIGLNVMSRKTTRSYSITTPFRFVCLDHSMIYMVVISKDPIINMSLEELQARHLIEQ